MKKISAFLLAVCLIINAFTFMPVSAERVVLYYVNHDFESVEGVKQITVTNIAPDPTKQSQYEILGESYPWRTALYNGSTPSFSYEPNGDSFTGDPQPFHNTTAYIKSSGKNQYPKLTMEMKNPQTGEIEATSGHLGILYIDLRIKRIQAWDHTDIYFMDSAGKTSSILFLPNGGTPSHAPRINGKSTSTGLPTTTTIANSQLTDWWYYRVILDFNTKKQKAFIGETLDTLMPFRSDTSDYDFYDSNAKDFYKVIIGNGNKSAFSFDDFRVYSISGVPMPAATASLSGKIYIGEQLTGTYTYSEPALGEEEGDSIAYWEISDTPTFDSPTRLTGDIIMKAGEVSTYTIKEEDYGKYIRFCVIPKSISGEVGYTAVSEPTSAIAVYDIPTLNISPGRTEQELNFAWYCPKDFTDAVVQIAPKTQENIETFPETGVMTFTGVQNETAIEYMANKVTVSDIELNTEYVYRVGDGVIWSPIYTYRSADDLRSFDFIHTSDSHIGVSNPIDKDVIAWNDTLTKAIEKYPNARFLLSSGDQTDKGQEAQFNKFFEPEILRSLPIAAVGGSNHDDNINFKNHFHLPNLSEYSITTSGSDYYFTYGDALFMVLNTCNHSSDTHKSFMREAVAENPDVKWNFVMFHHSIFSACTHSTSSYIVDFRKKLSPEFTSLGVDAVFMGHDHGYVRTYIMDGLNPQKEQTIDEVGRIVNATGVQYITANSSTGNKFYDLVDPVQPWALVRSQLYKPSFSGISIKGNTLTIKTYRTDTMEVIDSVTICKEDAKPIDEADIILSADNEVLPIYGGKIQLALTPKDGAGIDLSGAEIIYETTEDGILEIDENGKVTVDNAVQDETVLRVWAKAKVDDITYISNAVTIQVKDEAVLPDFSILDDIINFIGIKDGVETEIPKDSATLPNIDTLKVNATVVKNNETEKELAIIVGLYSKSNKLETIAINLINQADNLIQTGAECPVSLELKIPEGANTEDLYAKVLLWTDISNQMMPIFDKVELAK